MANPESRLRFELQPYYGGEPFVLKIEPGNLGIQLMNTDGQFAGNPAGDGVYIKRMNENKKFYRALMEINDRSEDNMLSEGPNTLFKIVSLEIPGKDGNKTAILNALRTLARMQTPGGTSADFVASPPAATDGWLQNTALAFAALFGGGGASSLTQGHGPSRAISGELGPTMGSTLPEFAPYKYDSDFVTKAGEFVAPGNPEWVSMQSIRGTEGLDPTKARYLVDDDGKFMIAVSDLGQSPDPDTQDAKIDQRKEDMGAFGSELDRISSKVFMQVKDKAGLSDTLNPRPMWKLGLTNRAIVRATAEALIPRWNARTNQINRLGGRAKARAQAVPVVYETGEDRDRATEGVVDIDDSVVVSVAVNNLLEEDGWVTSKTNYDAKKGTLGRLRFARD